MSEKMKNSIYGNADSFFIATDCIIFGFDHEQLKLLLFKRRIEPFKNEWSLIGSFVKNEESVQAAANRVLEKSTGLAQVFLEELGCYGSKDRDPGARVISMAYFALIRLEEQQEQLTESYEAHWFGVEDIPQLILDHNEMVKDALEKLRRKARYEPIGFELLSEKFTIPQLQILYESIYQTSFDRRNFRKKILSMNILKKLAEKDKTTSRKGAFLYQFDLKKYEEFVGKGFNFVL